MQVNEIFIIKYNCIHTIKTRKKYVQQNWNEKKKKIENVLNCTRQKFIFSWKQTTEYL